LHIDALPQGGGLAGVGPGLDDAGVKGLLDISRMVAQAMSAVAQQLDVGLGGDADGVGVAFVADPGGQGVQLEVVGFAQECGIQGQVEGVRAGPEDGGHGGAQEVQDMAEDDRVSVDKRQAIDAGDCQTPLLGEEGGKKGGAVEGGFEGGEEVAPDIDGDRSGHSWM